jgi:hypothetical protein
MKRRSHSAIFAAAAAILLGGATQPLRSATPEVRTFSNSPADTSFALEGRAAGESKAASLAGQERSKIKLDFIPADERTRRTSGGYPMVTAPKGAYGVEGHGSPWSIFDRTGEPMTEENLAEWIRTDERYVAGMTVYLLCCETGKGDRCFAQKLADTLGTEVVAPTEKLWPQQDGLFIVAQERTHKKFGIFKKREQRADVSKPGTMKTFKPGETPAKLVSFRREEASEPSSSSSAPSPARTQTPKKPLLRASAKTAALLAGIHRQRDGAVYLNARQH